MGEERKEALRVEFDRSVKVEFHGANVTSDAGLLAFRELDEALCLTDMVADLLVDTRTGLNTRHTLLAQFRQSVYSRLAGYEDTNDAERLCLDPSIRQVAGRARQGTQSSIDPSNGPIRDRCPDTMRKPTGTEGITGQVDRPGEQAKTSQQADP